MTSIYIEFTNLLGNNIHNIKEFEVCKCHNKNKKMDFPEKNKMCHL